jgi:hypothetical protein
MGFRQFLLALKMAGKGKGRKEHSRSKHKFNAGTERLTREAADRFERLQNDGRKRRVAVRSRRSEDVFP